jgi:hypothetical protein
MDDGEAVRPRIGRDRLLQRREPGGVDIAGDDERAQAVGGRSAKRDGERLVPLDEREQVGRLVGDAIESIGVQHRGLRGHARGMERSLEARAMQDEMKERLFALGDDFKIRGADGNDAFFVDGSGSRRSAISIRSGAALSPVSRALARTRGILPLPGRGDRSRRRGG